MTLSRILLGLRAQLDKISFTFFLSFAAILLTSSIVAADDTEIFFSQAEGDTTTHPNIVFILDNSGSMGVTGVGTQSKMDDMKDAMHQIIDSTSNINLGLVNFLGSRDNHGSRMVYPVTPIDTPGARQAMKDAVDAMGPDFNTPLVGALYESAMVLRGGNIEETSATYTTPMVGECQNNHIVMLSDGQPWQNTAVPKTEALIGRTCSSPGGSFSSRSGECGVELAQWLNDTDHAPHLSRDKNITVSTIGFNIRSTFLSDVANAGGGDYYEANRTDELVEVFNEIITTVKDIDTTFVAPASSINQFNRLTQSNDLFFGMFKPDSKAVWSGNLKRYQLGHDGSGITIKDADGNVAVDETTGLFLDTARSFWSDADDGNNVELGGAAEQITSAGRVIYTHVGAIPPGGIALTNVVTATNGSIQTMLNTLPADTREDLLQWATGKERESLVERHHMGSVLHSTPVTVNYSSHDPLIFVGTNEGFLHAVEKSTGNEKFSFIPQELIPEMVDFYSNVGAKNRPHGLDGEITLHMIDNDGDSVVDPGDKAYLFVGMRRGGDDYYAFDVTNPNSPKLMWRIDGGVGDFSRLGQTWSKPVPTKIYVNGAEKTVLIFGGGYNTNHDSAEDGGSPDSNQRDLVGSTIYIVDALTGEKIWEAYEDIRGISGHMRYAIPSDLRIIDINGDQYADRIYVGDMGGQVWRFDIKSYHQAGDGIGGLVDGGRIANFHDNTNKIRFYNEPDVALMSYEGERFMSVSIGSGWRAHPLNESIVDRFYMIRDNSPLAVPDGYGVPNSSGTSFQPATERDLTDVTTTLVDSRSDHVDMEGWMIRLMDNGEKNLSKSITVNNQVIFTTYAPIPPADICSPGSGRGYIYVLNAVNGDPALPMSGGSSATLTTDDRKKILSTQSIPPPPSAVIAEVGGQIRTSVITGTETPVNNLPFSDLTKRTYWQDKRRGNMTPAACRAGGSGSIRGATTCR